MDTPQKIWKTMKRGVCVLYTEDNSNNNNIINVKLIKCFPLLSEAIQIHCPENVPNHR